MTEKDAVGRFVAQMGFAAEQDRLPRIAGYMVATLLMEEGSLCLDELAKRLKVSRASVSTNARLLQGLGVIERVSQLGNRRDHYHIAADPGRELLRSTARLLRERSQMLAETRRELDGKPIVKKRLADMEKFYRAVGRGIERAIVELAGE